MLYPRDTRLSFKFIFTFIILFVFGASPAFAAVPDCYEEPIALSHRDGDGFTTGPLYKNGRDQYAVMDQGGGYLYIGDVLPDGTYTEKCIIGPSNENCRYTKAEVGLIGCNDGPQGLKIGDLDSDGFADLLVADFADIWFFRNVKDYENGGRTLSKPQALSYHKNPRSILLEYVNSDNALDILVGTFTYHKGIKYSAVAVGLNDGLGNFDFTIHPVTPNPEGSKSALTMEYADVIGDPAKDIIMAGAGRQWGKGFFYGAIGMLQGTALGTFAAEGIPLGVLHRVRAIKVADIDGDGDNDIIGGTYGDFIVKGEIKQKGNKAVIFFNEKDNFAQAVYSPLYIDFPPTTDDPGLVTSILAKDVDGDTDIDLVFNRDTSAPALVMYNPLVGGLLSFELFTHPLENMFIEQAGWARISSQKGDDLLMLDEDGYHFLVTKKTCN